MIVTVYFAGAVRDWRLADLEATTKNMTDTTRKVTDSRLSLNYIFTLLFALQFQR